MAKFSFSTSELALFADIPCLTIKLGFVIADVVVAVNCVTLFLSFTVKSPALLFELSNTLKADPFNNPCADDVLNVVTLLLKDVESIEIGYPRCSKNWFAIGNGSPLVLAIDILVVLLIDSILL